MSYSGGVRWYRTGLDRVALAFIVASVGSLFGVPFLVGGIAHAEIPKAVAGGVLLVLPALWACVILRAGIGVTSTHLLIRGVLGSTQAVPWPDVTGFAVTGSGRGRAFRVHGQGGQRWSTVGCSLSGWNRQDEELALWRLTRALEDERLARSPGAASEVPPRPPEPVRAPWARREGRRLFIDTVLVAFLGLSVYIAWNAVGGVGPAFRAADGAGTPGSYIPQSKSCGKSDCTWYGEFRLSDGRVARTDVTIADTSSGDLQAGTPVAATDVGDDDDSNGGSGVVFPAHDHGAWSSTVTVLVQSASWAAMLVVVLLGQVVRRPRRAVLAAIARRAGGRGLELRVGAGRRVGEPAAEQR
jgi:hypothetical protein